MPKLLDDLAAARADELALADDTGEATWGTLAERVSRLMCGLRDAGLRPGDTVAMMMGNRRECFELFWAAAHLGITYVPVNWHWVADELAYVLEDADARALFVGDRFTDVCVEALADQRASGVQMALLTGDPSAADGVGDGRLTGYEAFLDASSTDEPDDQWMGGPMFYTSGTTGRPKGVRGTLAGSAETPAEVLQLIATAVADFFPVPGRTLLAGPVYHSAQWAFSFLPMVAGSPVVMRHRFDAAEVVRLIDEYQITNVHLVPTQFKRMLELPDAVRDGAFREDLYYRLSVFPIEMPPLYKRKSDLPQLLEELLIQHQGEQAGELRVSKDALNVLTRYTWPGNIRELSNLVERLAILYPDGEIGVDDLPEKYRDPANHHAASAVDESTAGNTGMTLTGVSLKLYLRDLEVDMIRKAMHEADGVVAGATRLLNMRRTTLVEKLSKYDISA